MSGYDAWKLAYPPWYDESDDNRYHYRCSRCGYETTLDPTPTNARRIRCPDCLTYCKAVAA